MQQAAVIPRDQEDAAIRVGVVGYGYWGPNIVRNFHTAEGAQVICVSDLDIRARRRVQSSYPQVRVTASADELIAAPDIDAVAIVTPVSTHYKLAKKALEQGKHVFVEKPFTCMAAQAEDLINLAERKNLKIMIDHTFLFTGAVRKIHQFIQDGTLGNLYYYDSMRVNLGLFQHDVNVIWDLAPHDLSIMDYLIEEKPTAISATGGYHFNDMEFVAYITVFFPNNMVAHFNVNWLSPVKVRTTLVGGEKKMLVWNDLEVDEKIKVYDKGIEIENREGVYDLLVSYRSGDMWAPKIEQKEALRLEAEYFVDCVVNDKTPFNDGHAGHRIVKILQAADRSVKNRGELVYL